MRIALSDQEAEVLRETLASKLSDLSVEIAATDRKAYRDEVKSYRELLRSIARKLDAPAT